MTNSADLDQLASLERQGISGLSRTRVNQKILTVFSMKSYVVAICEVPHQGTSNEYPQNMFS